MTHPDAPASEPIAPPRAERPPPAPRSPLRRSLDALNAIMELARARLALRACDVVGRRARVRGRLRVENDGYLAIGDRCWFTSTWTPCELTTGPAGRLTIGDGVWVNFGTQISALAQVRIGHRVMIGQHCIIGDSDYPHLGVRSEGSEPRPVDIGDDVWLAGRVTVRPGVRIGAGAVIVAGSIVDSDIPPGVIAGGIPARPLTSVGSAPAGTGAAPDVRPQTAPAEPAAPAAVRLRGQLIADFTIDDLVAELARDDADSGPGVDALVAPYGQVAQTLLAPPPAGASDFAVVWTLPESAVPSYARLVRSGAGEVDTGAVDAEVDALIALVARASSAYRYVFVATWTRPAWDRGLGLLDARPGGTAWIIQRMNARLMHGLGALPNVYALDASRWLAAVGPASTNAKAWYLGKMAWSPPVFAEAARDLRAALGALLHGPRKLVVLDLDDTLWGGIVGDVGWEGLRLGEPDGIGEAHADFQRALLDLKRRGIVLAIASKNEEAVALEAIRCHPAMVLREQDFVAWRINWQDKARNILELARQLNLGLQSVVFIDDNPVERARVREALPEVYVPEWPAEPFQYRRALSALRCFDAPVLSQEDLERTRMYAEESQRDSLLKQVGSVDEWLATLGLKITVARLDAGTLARAGQLLNKTNQMNLSTRRLSESELRDWAASPAHEFWVVSVADRFGSAGLTGLLGLEFAGDEATIADFVLSCRVMGRRVEETMMHVAVASARARGARRLLALYRPTAKNKPCHGFLAASGLATEDDTRFVWDCGRPYELPAAVSLDWPGPGR